MNLSPLSNALLLVCFLTTFKEIITINSIHFPDDVSINCGSTAISSARSGRKWLGDYKPPKSLLQLQGSSTTSNPIHMSTSADPVPHMTARISSFRFSYTFHLNPGQKIIRLYFNPSPYKGFKGYKDFFTVQAGGFTLLSNFSTSLTAVNSFTKEFCLNVQENQPLTLTFSPQSVDNYAYINGIEIISVPVGLSYFRGGDVGLQVIGNEYVLYVDNTTALEMIQRLNIRQEDRFSSNDDFESMFPVWAMQRVEKNRSRTWRVPVDVGFGYLIRLHFSELGGVGDVLFKVLINGRIAQTNNDVMKASDGDYDQLFRDYMVMMRGVKEEGKVDLLLTFHSYSYDDGRDGHGILTGFEVLKMSNPDNSLASPNPLPPPQVSPSLTIQISSAILGYTNTNLTLALIAISLLNIIVYNLRKMWEDSNPDEGFRPSAKAERLCCRFSLAEIQLATRNFSDGLIIGRGGFGLVYKGVIDKGQKTVAVKRSNSTSKQGAREFLTEIEVLSQLRHINMISLIGYCSERREMILVYEYMPNGTLADHLYKLARRGMDSSPLSWNQRLHICIGAGQGLHYLHTGHRVIHRDVKASNILLDENFEAKVSDFGLAKSEDRSRLQSHVSTNVRGTFGYFDPYYMTTQKLTRKSDTYAFGVVLLEALSGRPAVDSKFAQKERVLTSWARDRISEGEVDKIVDLSLRDEISSQSLNTFMAVAIKCLEDDPKDRPTMSQVVLQLELALELQESGGLDDLPTSNHNIDVDTRDVISSNEDTVSSNIAELSKTFFTDVQTTVIFAPKKQPNLNSPPADTKEGRKKKSYIRAWGAFWTRMNPIKKKEFGPVSEGIQLPSDLCRHFSLDEIKTATRKFSDQLIIGVGGFGNVYKGVIDSKTTVAIKRLSSSSNQGAHEFATEIQMLSKLRHLHLVSLIGYCTENEEMILVYDYMQHGSLRDHLYNRAKSSPLTWDQRLEICLGAAKGLNYLHTGAEQTIIHRDVKSSNILLDDKWVAKICDFGVSKVWPSGEDNGFVTTLVKGTYGYLDPEYYMHQQLTDKSDVYSFGVTLLEILCGRPPIIRKLREEKVNLVKWALSCHRKGTLDQIIDSNLKGRIGAECLNQYVGTAVACLRERGNDRPPMSDIILRLESAIKLQQMGYTHIFSM